jgi:hypothetical protein
MTVEIHLYIILVPTFRYTQDRLWNAFVAVLMICNSFLLPVYSRSRARRSRQLGLLDGVSAMAAALYLFYGFRIFKIDKML